MGFLDSISSIVSPIASIGGIVSGLFGESDAKRQQEEAIRQLQQDNANTYQNLQANNQKTLLQATGTGGDALSALGSRLGSSYANAGLYNSSAVAGGLNQAAASQNASLADLAARQNFQSQNLLDTQRNQVANLQLGQGTQNLGMARADLGGSVQGLQSYLQSMTQNNLSRVGHVGYDGGMNGGAGALGYPGGSLAIPGTYGSGYDSSGYPKPKLTPNLSGYNF